MNQDLKVKDKKTKDSKILYQSKKYTKKSNFSNVIASVCTAGVAGGTMLERLDSSHIFRPDFVDTIFGHPMHVAGVQFLLSVVCALVVLITMPIYGFFAHIYLKNKIKKKFPEDAIIYLYRQAFGVAYFCSIAFAAAAGCWLLPFLIFIDLPHTGLVSLKTLPIFAFFNLLPLFDFYFISGHRVHALTNKHVISMPLFIFNLYEKPVIAKFDEISTIERINRTTIDLTTKDGQAMHLTFSGGKKFYEKLSRILKMKGLK